MKNLKSLFKKLSAADFIVISLLVFLTILNIIFINEVDKWIMHIAVNLIIIAFIFFSAEKSFNSNKSFWRHAHLWYLVPFVFIVFKELYGMIEPIRGKIYDDILILIDRFIFRADPTVILYQISNPVLTELLQIVYGTFFFLPVILGIEFIRKNKLAEFDYSAFIIVYGFCLSFLGYILVPAIGPRFTLHNFDATNSELPGIFITNFLREIVNTGESIPSGTINPAFFVQRDVFPSGHTQMTLLVMYLSVKFKSRLKWFFLINGSLLIFATVYLRYHYVIDLIGGLIFMIFTLWSGKYIYAWWNKFKLK